MKIQQRHWTKDKQWHIHTGEDLGAEAQLVLAFGGKNTLVSHNFYNDLRAWYPKAHILLGSTSGEIIDTEVHDESLVVTAMAFEKTMLKIAHTEIKQSADSYMAGEGLAKQLNAQDLKHIFILSDGMQVNGTALVAGLASILGDAVSVTGGLAGDAASFQSTLVGIDNDPQTGQLVAVGLYGEALNVGYASFGGWSSFGAERTVTKSDANVLYELDGKPALELYKTYLGKKAQELPAAALLFPLSIKNNQAESNELVRTILSIDEAQQSMTFAGDIPMGSIVKLMKSDHESLIEGAEKAAQKSQEILGSNAELAVLVSCVGRKLVLGQNVEEEIEVIRDNLGQETIITGFYSYGELAPARKNSACLLHNQTMTITLFSEK
ncbi:MAG: hypothetical protein EAZ55_03485 [Cytophagales bacterium]|nr:MAG: hypothetical protein EAZ55_03485 [Cytophagales bacterium]